MTKMIKLPVGYNVDLDTVTIEFKDCHVTERAERLGKPFDAIAGFMFADAVREDGSRWKCLLNVREYAANTDKKRATAKTLLNMYFAEELKALNK